MAPVRPVILALVAACALASPASAQAPLPTLSVEDRTVPEGAAATTATAGFKVTLSEPSLAAVFVSYATADGSAKQPGDYQQQSGLLSFGPGETEKTVDVPVQGDALDEDDETFTLDLSDPLGATAADGQGLGTIIDDDVQPSLSIGDPTVFEGSSGTSEAVFPVALSAASGKAVAFDYATQDGEAEQPGDYSSTTGTVTFDPGETQKTISVPVVPDSDEEPNETFRLVPSNPHNVTVPAGEEAVATIIDDDLPAIVDLPPIARVDVNPQQAFVGKVVEFNGSRSSDPERQPLQYSWDLDGDGEFETPTGTESAVGIAFFGVGTQFVGLRVTDPGGRSGDQRASAQIFPAPPRTARDTTPPSTHLFPVRRSLRLALRRGIRVRFGCSEACLIAGSVGVDRRTGRRLGLEGRKRTMGRAFSATTKAGSKVLRLKLSRRARRALARLRKVRVNLRFAVRDPAFNVRVTNHRITLRR